MVKAMAILVTMAVILYLFLWSTAIYYLINMKKSKDDDRRLRLTYNCLGAVALEQIIGVIAIVIFYAVRLNDVEIEVPELGAVISFVIFVIGLLLTAYFWFGYRKKYFPQYCKKGEVENKAIHLNHIITVGCSTSAMNLIFNLMSIGAISYLIY